MPLQSTTVFEGMAQQLKQHPELVGKVKAVFVYTVSGTRGETKTWTVDLKNGAGSIQEGKADSDCSITMKDDDFMKLIRGDLDPQMAFMQGKLKLKGNMMLAQKLETVFSSLSVEEPPKVSFEADALFEDLKKRVASHPELVSKVRSSFCFNVTKDKTTRTWIVDLKNSPGSVQEAKGSADVAISLSDSNFAKLMAGKLDPQMAFMQGKIKLKGNMMTAMKLNALMKPKAAL